jgi:hypothetical protein
LRFAYRGGERRDLLKRINRERLQSLGTVQWIGYSSSVSGGLGIPRLIVATKLENSRLLQHFLNVLQIPDGYLDDELGSCFPPLWDLLVGPVNQVNIWVKRAQMIP